MVSMWFPFLATNVSPHNIMLLRANKNLFKLPFEKPSPEEIGSNHLSLVLYQLSPTYALFLENLSTFFVDAHYELLFCWYPNNFFGRANNLDH
jgi:hypothetical protein